MKPAIVEAKNAFEIVQHETFAPILYIMKYSGDVENAIAIQNDVPQGLSSAIMTNSLKESEAFLSVQDLIVELQTLTSELLVLKLVEHLVERKKQVADVSLDLMLGKST